MKVSVAVILFLVLPNVHVAQDSTYIKDFSNKLNVRIGIDSDNYSFKIRNKINKEYYQLNPNETERLTLGIVYRFLVLNAEYAPHLHDNELRGESEIQSIQLRVFIKRFVQQFAYNNIKGFYLQNTSDYVPNWNKNQPYITYDDLGVKRISGRTTFVSNRNFSYKAIAFQSQKQLKSTGSFMPSISYDYTKLNNFKNELKINDEENYDVNFNVGYIYNFVFGKDSNYYASINASTGLGTKLVTFSSEIKADNTQQLFTNFNVEGGISLGYNTEKVFTGLIFNTSSVSYNRDIDTNIENSNVYVHVFVGYRFGAPQFLSQFFNTFYKKKS